MGKLNTSKYDFVKVRVWLGEHFYVLSRLQVSRLLTFAKVPSKDAVQIALELKRALIQEGQCDVKQPELEDRLFRIMQTFKYDNYFIDNFRMVCQFSQQRIPLIILISGTQCIGKSVIARYLATRLNLSTVHQTEIVYDLCCTIDPSLCAEQLFAMEFPSDQDRLLEYERRCKAVRHALDRDLTKAVQNGKHIIIEGLYIDHALYADLLDPIVPAPALTAVPVPAAAVVLPTAASSNSSSFSSFPQNAPVVFPSNHEEHCQHQHVSLSNTPSNRKAHSLSEDGGLGSDGINDEEIFSSSSSSSSSSSAQPLESCCAHHDSTSSPTALPYRPVVAAFLLTLPEVDHRLLFHSSTRATVVQAEAEQTWKNVQAFSKLLLDTTAPTHSPPPSPSPSLSSIPADNNALTIVRVPVDIRLLVNTVTVLQDKVLDSIKQAISQAESMAKTQ